ncbi:NTR domain-containing protein [Trichonephila clavipes]|nr:NTR domain-containing protein [Trichonephila clavipes]
MYVLKGFCSIFRPKQVLGTGDIPTVHYEYWVSTVGSTSRLLPQHSFHPLKTVESPAKPSYHSQTHQPLENTIEDSSQTNLISVTKFQGYKSFYHRNEVLKSVPSWSIKRHKTFKHPLNREFTDIKNELNSNKWRNATITHLPVINDRIRHLENSWRIPVEKKPVTEIGGISYDTTVTAIFYNRTANPETATKHYYDISRPNVTSAFTSYNHLAPDYKNKGRRKSLDNSVSVDGRNENLGRKESKRHESKNKNAENKRAKRKRKSNHGECPQCSRVKNQVKNFCLSDFVLRAIVLAIEKQQQGNRFELEVVRSYKNKVPIVSREYVWTLDNCHCPKLRIGKEYIVMGHSRIAGGRRESRLIVDSNSFIRKYSEKRARTMLRLVRDKNSVCRKFGLIL